MRASVAAVLGPERAARFFDRLLTRFFEDERRARCSPALGVNCVRIPVNYRHFERDERPFELREEGFERLDRVVRAVRRARHLQRDRPARGARLPEPALALRQPDARRRLLAAPALPGPRRAPVAGVRRRAIATSPWVGGLQPAQRARRPERRGRRAVPRPARGRRPRDRPRPHRLRRRQHVLDGLLDVRRALRERRLRLPRLRARRDVVRRPVPGRDPGPVDRPRLPRGEVPRALQLPARDRHADLGRRVRPGLHRRPRARRAALPDPLRPARHLRPPRRRVVDLDLQGRRPAGARPHRARQRRTCSASAT